MPDSVDNSNSIPRWVKDRLNFLEDNKSDKGVMKSEIKRLDEKLDDLEEISGVHNCAKESEISLLRGDVYSNCRTSTANTSEIRQVYRWYVRGLAALILFLVTSGVGFAWYLAGMAYQLEAQAKSLEKVERKLESPLPSSDQLHILKDILNKLSSRPTQKSSADEAVVRANGFLKSSNLP